MIKMYWNYFPCIYLNVDECWLTSSMHQQRFKGMEHVPNIFVSFDKYLFLEVINILI